MTTLEKDIMNNIWRTAVAIVFIGVTSLLAGCSQNTGPEGVHSYAWYKKDPSAAVREDNWCKKTQAHPANPLKWLGSPVGRSCSNAAWVVDDLNNRSYPKT